MSFWDYRGSPPNQSLNNYVPKNSPPFQIEFYEAEMAVVLDVILDKDHEIFQKKVTDIGLNPWPADLNGDPANVDDKDYSWIGRIKFRFLTSNKKVEKEQLGWALPMEANLSEYPLVNELVVVVEYPPGSSNYYYSRKVNCRNFVNNNADFSKESVAGSGQNREEKSNTSYIGPLSKSTFQGGMDGEGVVGRYFWINKNIRSIKRHEGDTIIESRFGQSIRFGAYDDDRKNDVGDPKQKDYYGLSNGALVNPWSNQNSGGGNPMILIRNRQRPVLEEGKTLQLQSSPNPSKISGNIVEKNVGGYITENINHDGSSIHMTSGQTISKWVTTCYKKMFGMGEEVSVFSGKTNFKSPILNGDQIVINTDRLILSARYGETFHYSKKRYAIVTDNEYTVDAHQQIVFTTHTKTVINSPAIYLGQYDETNEPALLGQTTVNWLYNLCGWMLAHTHWYIHSHKHAGKESPSQTQLPVEIRQLEALRGTLKNLLSKRVFVTGGGLAGGQNGKEIPDGEAPVIINTNNGSGVPGGWRGDNYRNK